MDDIVKQAMAKWPNVPHCYGWLALDARGGWRMRDDRAQALGLPGDRINNPALLGFINRNYQHDDQGRWYFQNGPQRVYVSLEATPYIARTDPAEEFVLHTGEPLGLPDAAWMTETGQLVLQANGRLAQVDDRDMAQCLPRLRLDAMPVDDERLLAWLNDEGRNGEMTLETADRQVPVAWIASDSLPVRFQYVRMPAKEST